MKEKTRRMIGDIIVFGSVIGSIGGFIYVIIYLRSLNLTLTLFTSLLISAIITFIMLVFMVLGILIGVSFIRDDLRNPKDRERIKQSLLDWIPVYGFIHFQKYLDEVRADISLPELRYMIICLLYQETIAGLIFATLSLFLFSSFASFFSLE